MKRGARRSGGVSKTLRRRAPLRLLDSVCVLLNLSGALLTLVLMVLIVADIVGRGAFNRPIFGVPEIAKLSVVAIAWLQMAHTAAIGAHLRTTLVLLIVPAWMRRVLEIISCLLAAIFFGLIAYSEWPAMIAAWRTGEFEGALPVRIPTLPVHAVLVAGAVLTALQFLTQAFASLFAPSIEPSEPEIIPETSKED